MGLPEGGPAGDSAHGTPAPLSPTGDPPSRYRPLRNRLPPSVANSPSAKSQAQMSTSQFGPTSSGGVPPTRQAGVPSAPQPGSGAVAANGRFAAAIARRRPPELAGVFVYTLEPARVCCGDKGWRHIPVALSAAATSRPALPTPPDGPVTMSTSRCDTLDSAVIRPQLSPTK
jgi:hypothetical protein